MSKILVVGSVAYDSVITKNAEASNILGGSATHFSVSASFFTDTSLVACVGRDFSRRDHEFLESRDIDLQGLQYLEGETFRWTGDYTENFNQAKTLDTQLNVLANFQPMIPKTHQNHRYVFLGNIDPKLQQSVISQVETPRIVAADTMNYWIESARESVLQVLRLVDVLLINDGEARQLAEETTLVAAAHKILSYGPSTLVVKLGEYGACLYQKTGDGLSVFGVPAYPLKKVCDPTGAGDTFAGGFMGYLAAMDRADLAAMRKAVVFGSVMASFNVEDFSLDRLRNLTFQEVCSRYHEFEKLTAFNPISPQDQFKSMTK
jgi:sugar/nucleoside kinase (ribokinase family)